MILDNILRSVKARIDRQMREVPLTLLREKAESNKSSERAGCFTKALQKNKRGEGLGFICEIKKASPSKGIIHEHFPYLTIAQEYERSGADAISCLSEPEFFLGSDEIFTQVREQIALPLLRKDFTINPYMIYQAKAMGADAVLLIASVLDDVELADFYQLSCELGLCALIETHNAKEIERALRLNPSIIGVNNRDLRTFSVDVRTSIELRALVPESIVFVSESGIGSVRDVEMLRDNGVDALLIGEWFMKEGAHIT